MSRMDTVLGLFKNRSDAIAAVNRLQRAGYSPSDISVVVKDEPFRKGGLSISSRFGENAVTGATAGGVIAGVAGLLIGLGAIVVPGIGALFIGGPIAASLGLTGAAATAVSAATTGVLAGGIVGALSSLGVSPDIARTYEQHLQAGAVLLAVPVKNRRDSDKVRNIFDTYYAYQTTVVHDMGKIQA